MIAIKPTPSVLEKHLSSLRRCIDRKARAEYLIGVHHSDGPDMAAALHTAYAEGWTLQQARLAEIKAAQPLGRAL